MQVLLGGFAALGDVFALVGIPGTRLGDYFVLNGQVYDITFAADALIVHNVEFGFAERRRHLIFDDFDAYVVADNRVTLFDLTDTADIHTHRSVELKGIAAGGSFG